MGSTSDYSFHVGVPLVLPEGVMTDEQHQRLMKHVGQVALQAAQEYLTAARCVNDSDGDGDCAGCARDPRAPCRRPVLAVAE